MEIKKIDMHVHTHFPGGPERLRGGTWPTPEEVREVYDELGIEKDIDKAITLFEEASNNNKIEASIELLKIYIEKYLKERTKETLSKINYYKNKIETHNKYNLEIKKELEKDLLKIKEEYLININI